VSERDYLGRDAASDATRAANAAIAAGLAWEDTRDFEDAARGLIAPLPDGGTLQAGAWQRAIPNGGGGRGDPPSDFDGSGFCYVTQNGAGDTDVDGGPTRLLSPVLDLSSTSDPLISYARWFYNDDNDIDRMTVEISNNGGTTWTLVESIAGSTGWVLKQIRVADYVTPNSQVRMRFSVADQPNDSVTEAGLDAFAIRELVCSQPATLTGFQVAVGTYTSGVLGDLLDSDDSYVRARSGFGALLSELHKMQVLVSATTTNVNASALSMSVESRVDQPTGQSKFGLRDWVSGQVVDVGSAAVSNADGTDTVSGVSAGNYVDGAGNIEASFKFLVHVPFLAFQFDTFIDQVEVLVE